MVIFQIGWDVNNTIICFLESIPCLILVSHIRDGYSSHVLMIAWVLIDSLGSGYFITIYIFIIIIWTVNAPTTG